jgi:hypothetical protein
MERVIKKAVEQNPGKYRHAEAEKGLAHNMREHTYCQGSDNENPGMAEPSQAVSVRRDKGIMFRAIL